MCGLFDAVYFPFSCLLSVILSSVFFSVSSISLFLLSLLLASKSRRLLLSVSQPLSCFLFNIVYFLIVSPFFLSTSLHVLFSLRYCSPSLCCPSSLYLKYHCLFVFCRFMLPFFFSSFLFITLSLSPHIVLCYRPFSLCRIVYTLRHLAAPFPVSLISSTLLLFPLFLRPLSLSVFTLSLLVAPLSY